MTTEFTDKLPDLPPTEAPAIPLPSKSPAAPAAVPGPEAKSSRWAELAVTVVLASLVAGVVAVGMVVVVEVSLGRLTPAEKSAVTPAENPARGGPTDEGSKLLEVKYNGTILTQKGRLTVPSEEPVEVIYPIPYRAQPALNWNTSNGDYFKVTDQKPTGFKVTSKLAQAWEMRWEASGVCDKDAAPAK
jgi:hypothetical protein